MRFWNLPRLCSWATDQAPPNSPLRLSPTHLPQPLQTGSLSPYRLIQKSTLLQRPNYRPSSDLPALTIPFSPERAQEAMKPSMAPFSLTFAPAQTTEQPNVVVWSAPPPLPALNPFSFAKPAYTPAAATQSSAPFTPACNLSFFS